MKDKKMVIVFSAVILFCFAAYQNIAQVKPDTFAGNASVLYEIQDGEELAEMSTNIVMAEVISFEEINDGIVEITAGINESYKGECEEKIYIYENEEILSSIKKGKGYFMFLEGVYVQSYGHKMFSLTNSDSIYAVKKNKLESLTKKGEKYIKEKYSKSDVVEMISNLTEDKSYKQGYISPKSLKKEELFSMSDYIGIVSLEYYSQFNKYAADYTLSEVEKIKGEHLESFDYIFAAFEEPPLEKEKLLIFLKYDDGATYLTAEEGALIRENDEIYGDMVKYVKELADAQ